MLNINLIENIKITLRKINIRCVKNPTQKF